VLAAAAVLSPFGSALVATAAFATGSSAAFPFPFDTIPMTTANAGFSTKSNNSHVFGLDTESDDMDISD